jgi:hypothetical protein
MAGINDTSVLPIMPMEIFGKNMKRKRCKQSFSLGRLAIPIGWAILVVVVVLRTCFR